MKLSDWLTKTLTPLFEKKEEAELFASASAFKDIEIPDAIASKFDSQFLTRDRAMADEEIIKSLNKNLTGKIYSSVDYKLSHGILEKISAEDRKAIDAEPNTLLKMDLLGKAIDNLAKNEDIKKANEVFRKKEEDLHKKITELESTVQEKDKSFETRLKESQLDFNLKNKLFAIELAPEFADDVKKNFLADSTISTLKKNFVLEVDPKDQSIALRKNVDGAVVDVYNESNKKVTLDDYLKKTYEPFIKKSAGSGNTPPDNGGKKKEVIIKNDQPLTLREKMLAANPV